MKEPERYVFVFTPGSEAALLASLLRTVRDGHGNLTWNDLLAVLSRLREFIFGAEVGACVVHKVVPAEA
ncbi:MAG: hypothetical protein L0216_17300 [Planctomycetales bacterium]|nr:hypothetical protein [Planctomycetales bacterium]